MYNLFKFYDKTYLAFILIQKLQQTHTVLKMEAEFLAGKNLFLQFKNGCSDLHGIGCKLSLSQC